MTTTRADDDSWTFQCPGVPGDPCGDADSGGSFRSSGWPTKKIAAARGEQHLIQHKLGPEIQAAIQRALNSADDPELVDLVAVRGEAIRESDYDLMPDLDDFRAEHGLVPHADGIRAVQNGDDA